MCLSMYMWKFIRLQIDGVSCYYKYIYMYICKSHVPLWCGRITWKVWGPHAYRLWFTNQLTNSHVLFVTYLQLGCIYKMNWNQRLPGRKQFKSWKSVGDGERHLGGRSDVWVWSFLITTKTTKSGVSDCSSWADLIVSTLGSMFGGSSVWSLSPFSEKLKTTKAA